MLFCFFELNGNDYVLSCHTFYMDPNSVMEEHVIKKIKEYFLKERQRDHRYLEIAQ